MKDPRFSVEILHAALQRFAAPWRWTHKDPLLNWPGYILWTVLEGGATMHVGSQTHEVSAGDVVLMDMTLESNWYEVTQEHGLAILEWVHFVYSTPPEEIPRVYRRIRFLGFWDQLVHRATTDFYARSHRPGFSSRWMAALLQELYLQDHNADGVSNQSDARAKKLHQLCREIRMNPGKTWSLEEMAGRLALSVGHFARVFEEVRGTKPGQFIIGARIDAARELLRLSNLPIKEIAQRLGYCDAFAFSKQFRARMGVSPTDYRRASAPANGQEPSST